MTKDEMVGWHHWLDEHEFDYAPGVGDGQGSLACCSAWGVGAQLQLCSAKSWTWLSDWTDWLMDFPGGTVVKNLPASAGDPRDVGWIPASGRSLGVGNGNPFQYSCLKILACLSYGQGSLVGWSPWGHKKLDMTERLKWTEPNFWLVTQTDLDKRIKGWNIYLTIIQWWFGATFCVGDQVCK